VLCDAYREEVVSEVGAEDTRVVMGFHPRLAPIKVACLPLSKKPDLQERAMKIYHRLSRTWDVDYDETGSIGKRYRRQDEVGTPLCVTVDFETLNDQAVTVRHRDTMKQDRVSLDQLVGYLEGKLENF
jgi:glycyl-tRNA synthetase